MRLILTVAVAIPVGYGRNGVRKIGPRRRKHNRFEFYSPFLTGNLANTSEY